MKMMFFFGDWPSAVLCCAASPHPQQEHILDLLPSLHLLLLIMVGMVGVWID